MKGIEKHPSGATARLVFRLFAARLKPCPDTKLLRDSEALAHFFVEQAFAGAVGLEPFAVNHQLRNGALADFAEHVVSGSRCGFDVDFGVGESVLVEEALGLAAVAAPGRAVES